MTTSSTGHSAAGQALGYLHQCMWALIELGRRAPSEPSVELRLESLDDIQFDTDGSAGELLQTKHHAGASGALSARSTDLWRTLNIWMDLTASDNLLLRLVTTQSLAADSPLGGLRAGRERDAESATSALLEAAAESTSVTTAPWRRKFIDLDEDARKSLLDRIVIDDNATPAPGFDQELTKTFRYAIPVGSEVVFAHLIKGWWSGVSVRLLARTLDAVTGEDPGPRNSRVLAGQQACEGSFRVSCVVS